jgi:hypothetical protein
MSPIQQMLLGSGGATEKTYLPDVFDVMNYTGDSSNSGRSFTTGVDLSGKGGMMLVVPRSNGNFHTIADTERGIGTFSYSNGDNAEQTNNDRYGSVTSTGYTLGSSANNSYINFNNYTYANYTFRKAAGFFTIITYTGNGSERTISHDLGANIGFIMIKRRTSSYDWVCWHEGLDSSYGSDAWLTWSSPSGMNSDSGSIFGSHTFNSSVFSVGTDQKTNLNGQTYVAYIWADGGSGCSVFGEDEDLPIIKTGHHSGNDQAKTINLGFEPGFIMYKNLNQSNTTYGQWKLLDRARGGLGPINADGLYSRLQSDEAEKDNNSQIYGYDSGFKLTNSSNSAGAKYLWIAIAAPRGKLTPVPETATNVFDIDFGNGSSNVPCFDAGFAPDTVAWRQYNTTDQWYWTNRNLARDRVHYNSATGSQGENDDYREGGWATQAGFLKSQNSDRVCYMTQMAQGFCDLVSIDSTGSNMTIDHKLNAVPEMMIGYGNGGKFWMWHKDIAGATSTTGDTDPIQYFFKINAEDVRQGPSNDYFQDFTPTSTQLKIGTSSEMNTGIMNIHVYASVAGVQKFGSYRGTGNNAPNGASVTLGFQPRFVMIRRVDAQQDFFVFDFKRGMAVDPSSNGTPYLKWNLQNGEGGSSNRVINATSTGFTIEHNSAGYNAVPGSGWNNNYIYWAIA